MKPKLAVIATHPIQYHEPWYRALAQRGEIDLVVYFLRELSGHAQGAGFGVSFEWDIPLRRGYRSEVLNVAQVCRRLRHDAIDAVLVTGWNEAALVLAALAARVQGIPVVVRGETSGLKPRSTLVSAVHRVLLRLYDAFLVIGEANRRFYQSHVIAPERLFAAPYFVENDRFAAQTAQAIQDRAAVRARWGVPESATCYLFAGKLQPKKRVMDFLEALQRPGNGAPIHGLVVGAGEQLAEARAYVEAHRLPVSFTGFLNQTGIAAAYAAADALVLPSDYGETWGLVVNEAMACGRPAFVSDRVGCGPDLVSTGATGEVFQFGDVEALGALMRQYAGRPGDLNRMGQAARQLVTRDYDVQRSVEAVVQAVSHVLASRRRK